MPGQYLGSGNSDSRTLAESIFGKKKPIAEETIGHKNLAIHVHY